MTEEQKIEYALELLEDPVNSLIASRTIERLIRWVQQDKLDELIAYLRIGTGEWVREHQAAGGGLI